MTLVGARSHGLVWQLELDSDRLLPGRLVDGLIGLTADGPVAARALVVTLIATERWQYRETTTDAQGRPSSRVVTQSRDAVRVPVEVAGAVAMAAGELRSLPFQVPVPGLGPASFEATVARLDWRLEARLDRPGALDSGVDAAVRVLQPTALLRAGVVDVTEFALYPAADAEAGGVGASITLDPMPICVDAPVHGRLALDLPRDVTVQEVRVELRVRARATVSSGLEETITLWTCRAAGPGRLSAGQLDLPIDDRVPALYLPTIELPHGRSDATVHVILARSMARDIHLVRDVTICSTTEL